jgi:hypothetical protein
MKSTLKEEERMSNLIESVLKALTNKDHHKEGIPEYEPFVNKGKDLYSDLEPECEDEEWWNWHRHHKIKEYTATIQIDGEAPITTYIKKGKLKMSLTLTDSQQVTLTVGAVDTVGVPVNLPAGTVWTNSDTGGTLGTYTPSADGSQLAFVTKGGVGSVTATATNGAFSATFEITVTVDAIAGLVITAGPVTSRLAPAPTPAPAAA